MANQPWINAWSYDRELLIMPYLVFAAGRVFVVGELFGVRQTNHSSWLDNFNSLKTNATYQLNRP